MATKPTDELALEIMRSLEIDSQWVKHFNADDAEGIAKARSAGRAAGRALQLKVVTVQSDPETREDGRVVVVVAVNQERTADDEERLQERARLLLDNFYRDNFPR